MSHSSLHFNPGSVFVFPGDEPVESLRRELRSSGLSLFEPSDIDEATTLLPELRTDLLLIEPSRQIDIVIDALQSMADATVDPPPTIVLASYQLGPLEAAMLYRCGVTDVVFPPHHPGLAIAKVGALLRMKRRLDAAHELSVRDELTGLFNRRFFLERLDQEIARTVRTGFGMALVTFDLDQFKPINDVFGHPVGDRALQAVAQIASRHTRRSDINARMGGDEFALLLSSNTLAGARVCAEGLRKKIEGAAIETPDSGVLTASFGIASFPSPAVKHPMEDLILEADNALLRAKQAGGNCVELSDIAAVAS